MANTTHPEDILCDLGSGSGRALRPGERPKAAERVGYVSKNGFGALELVVVLFLVAASHPLSF